MRRDDLLRRLLGRLGADPAVVAVVDCGSGAEGRADAWSDLDLVAFVPGTEVAERNRTFPALAASLAGGDGPAPFTYIAGDPVSGQCRAVFDADPLPLRLDLSYFCVSRLPEVATFSTRPASRAAMLLLDRTGDDRLAAAVDGLVGRPRTTPAPHDKAHLAGDVLYYLLRVETLRRRGDALAARTEFHWFVLGSLAGLARLGADRPGRWKSSLPAAGIHADCPAHAARIARCLPSPTDDDLRRACLDALRLAVELAPELSPHETRLRSALTAT